MLKRARLRVKFQMRGLRPVFGWTLTLDAGRCPKALVSESLGLWSLLARDAASLNPAGKLGGTGVVPQGWREVRRACLLTSVGAALGFALFYRPHGVLALLLLPRMVVAVPGSAILRASARANRIWDAVVHNRSSGF